MEVDNVLIFNGILHYVCSTTCWIPHQEIQKQKEEIMEWFWEMLDWTITPIAISIGVFFWIVIIWGDK